MGRRGGIVVVALALGCGEAASPAVQVQPGGVVRVLERDTHSLKISVSDADPFAARGGPDSFELAVSDSAAALFEALELVGSPGGVELEVRPRCDAVVPGGADVLVTVIVRTPSADPASVTLLVADNRGPACAPELTLWLGDCASPPESISTRVVIPAAPSPGPLCTRLVSADPARERLWLRASSTAPESLLAVDALPHADGVTDQTFTSTLGDSQLIRGTFTLSYSVFGAPGSAGGDLLSQDSFQIQVGPPGVSVQVEPRTHPVGELDVVTVPFTVWRAADDALEPCAKLERGGRPGGERPFARLTESATLQSSIEGWICGTSFTANVSPPADASPEETLLIHAAGCDCSGGPEVVGPIHTATVSVPVINRTDDLDCPPMDPALTAHIACAPQDMSDGAPLVVVMWTTAEASPRPMPGGCVFRGVRGGYEQLDVEQQAPSMRALPIRIRGLRATKVDGSITHHIIGHFETRMSAQVRVLESAGATYRWVAQNTHGLAIDPSADEGVLVGGTHLAYAVDEGGWKLRFDCIAASNCTDAEITGIAPAGRPFAGLAAGDVDRDGAPEMVVLFADPGMDDLHSMRATVVDFSIGRGGRVGPVTIGVDAAEIRVHELQTRLRTATMNTVERSSASVLAVGTKRPPLAQVLRLGRDGNDLRLSAINAPGAAIDLAVAAGRGFVAMTYGIWELTPSGPSSQRWTLRDPVLQADALAARVNAPPSRSYGRSIAACVGSDQIVFRVDDGTVRITELDVPVKAP